MTPVWVEEKTLVSKAGSRAQRFKETKPVFKKSASAAYNRSFSIFLWNRNDNVKSVVWFGLGSGFFFQTAPLSDFSTHQGIFTHITLRVEKTVKQGHQIK